MRTELRHLFDIVPEHRFRNIADEFDRVVDDGLGDATHGITVREVGKFTDLDHVGDDIRLRDCHPVGQPGHTWAMRSGGSDENLDVKVFIDVLQGFNSLFSEVRLRFRNVDEAAH